MVTNDALNQVARISDCDNCGHCVELYTPSDDDPSALKETRNMITNWVGNLLGKSSKKSAEFLQ